MKHRITTAALLLLLTVAAHSQDAIERLLPQLLACDNIDFKEIVDCRPLFNDGKSYSFFINTTPVGNLPEGLLDSLVAAFEYEYRFATESDRYRKHKDNSDSIFYTLAYNGTTHPEPNSSKLNVFNHSFNLDIECAATLDIYDNKFHFSFRRQGKPDHKPKTDGKTYDAASLKALFSEIAADTLTKSVPVRYDITDGNYIGRWQFQYEEKRKTHCHGMRLEIPAEVASKVYARMSDAIRSVNCATDQIYYYNKERNEINIIFGENWEGDVFCLRRMDDGRVFILHTETTPDSDVAIPIDWPTIDTINH